MYKRKTEQISQCNKQLNGKNKITHIEVHENRTINRKKKIKLIETQKWNADEK